MHLAEVPEPALLPEHAIIDVQACGICGTDLHIQAGEYPVDPPVILGHEFSGVVRSVAPDVTEVEPGQRVVSLVYFRTCGACELCRSGQPNLCRQRKSVGSGVNGAFAEQVLMPASNIRLLSDAIDFVSGALVEPLACCTHGVLEKLVIRSGDLVTVLGPGAIGLLTAQIAHSQGAIVVVIGTAADTERLELARRLGSPHTVEIGSQDPMQLIETLSRGVGADVVCECSGAAAAANLGLQLVRRRGQYLQLGLFGKRIELDYDQAVFKEVEMHNSFASTSASWGLALRLLEQEIVQTQSLVSDVLPLSDWERGFALARNREAVKVVLLPS